MLTRMIRKQAKRIDRIVEDTLAMARNKPTEPQNIHLMEFFESLFEEDLVDVKHMIQLELLENIQILFDDKQLRQVLINLVRNALRHNASDIPYIEIKVHAEETKVRIDVIDFGLGVAKETFLNCLNHFLVPKSKELV